MERATVAVVAEEGGAVVAFLAVTARAPMPDTSGADGHHDASARLAWAKALPLPPSEALWLLWGLGDGLSFRRQHLSWSLS